MHYLVKKIFILFFSIWCVITGTFFLMHAIPGDPFIGDRVIPEEVLRSLYAYYGLDKPIWIQYLKYLKGIFTLDFGVSIAYHGRPVKQFILEGLPISMLLGIQALCIAVPSGILLGTWAALKRTQWQDNLAMLISTLFVSVPNFVFSSLLQYLFAVKFHWVPVARWGGFEHTILPTLALAAMPTAFIARLTRSNMVEVLQQDYIRTAISKGLPLFRIAILHGLRNAILPVLSYLGPVITSILTGSFMVEKIFAIPGLGQWMIFSINGRDYPMIMGLAIFFCICLCVMVFLVDLLYSVLDPRIRFSERTAYDG
ncbi:MAG TPA: ABC transporter permease [Chlamydiales bacterium]|jgi:oligopeptide transport system permease protein|nr:ABC transporter permease [Chlamydiales bacterium]